VLCLGGNDGDSTSILNTAGASHLDFPSSAARAVAATTAFITVARIPPLSSACTPRMVVPPGEVTASLSGPICCSNDTRQRSHQRTADMQHESGRHGRQWRVAPTCLVSITIFAAPSTVCAASSVAMLRGRPTITPPSESASMNCGPGHVKAEPAAQASGSSWTW
jgi:hypothetical protein